MISAREATHDDIEAIVAFTTGTFEWGDYVPDMIGEWIDATDGVVMVAVDADDIPIAMGRCTMLTASEAWLHAARVHPEHRGRGIAGEMAVVMTDWARDNGGLVARLMIEESNTSSIRHIGKTGFRKTTVVHRGHRDLGGGPPRSNGNGGHRRKSPLQARPGRRSESDMVVASWSAGEAGRSLRGLVAHGWSFHRLNTADVLDTSDGTMLWEIGGATAITRQVDDEFRVDLLDASERDAVDVTHALIDVAAGRDAARFSIWVADLPKFIEALGRNGCNSFANGIYAMEL